jgi:DamX protein
MTEKPQPLLAAKVVERDIVKPHSWSASIAFVNHLVRETNVLLSLLGEKGSGKSEFSRVLQANLSPDIRSHLLVAVPSSDDCSVLEQINSLIGTDTNSAMSGLIEHVNEQEVHTLLIVDDAQYLSANFIESLLGALGSFEKTNYLHVCLISDFSLVPALTAFAQGSFPDKVHSIVLGTLNDEETKAFVQQYARVAPGFELIITDELLTKFQQLTQGRIQAINQEMNDFFSQPIAPKASFPKRFHQMGIYAGAFFGVIGLAYVVLSQNNQITQAETVTIAVQPLAVPEEKIKTVLSSNIPSYDLAATREILELSRDNVLGKEEGSHNKNNALAVPDKVAVARKIVQHPLKQAKIVKSNHNAALKKPLIKQVAKAHWVKPVNNSNRYTIQLLASRNKTHLHRFASVHNIAKTTKVYRVTKSGVNWYVLTLGQYTQKNHAVQAAKRLPNSVAQNKPWIRSLSDLKQTG